MPWNKYQVKLDKKNGTNINSNTLPVWNAYVEICALSTLHYFTHNIYPEVPKGCTLQNKELATLFQHANHDAIISIYKGHGRVLFPPGQPREWWTGGRWEGWGGKRWWGWNWAHRCILALIRQWANNWPHSTHSHHLHGCSSQHTTTYL
jgi:hypothetical protein